MLGSSFQSNKIFIIDALDNSGYAAGERLYKDCIRYDNIVSDYLTANTKDEFVTLLENINLQLKNNQQILPILHICAHGNESGTGLVLPNGDCIGWSTLKPHFANINLQCKNNLLIVFAACKSLDSIFMIENFKAAPFYAVIAPKDDVSGSDIVGYIDFYREFLSTSNITSAMLKLDATGQKFKLVDVLWVFLLSWRKHVAFYDSIPRYKIYKRQIVKMQGGKKAIPGLSRAQTNSQVRKKIDKTRRKIFKEMKEEFFMIDIYPGNDSRFPVTYEESLVQSQPPLTSTLGKDIVVKTKKNKRNRRTS